MTTTRVRSPRPRLPSLLHRTASTLILFHAARRHVQPARDLHADVPGVDPSDAAALEAFHGPFLNEPMPLERGLPWRARFFPHPSQPALMFSVHHIVGDGRSMVQLLWRKLVEVSKRGHRSGPWSWSR